MSEIRKVGALVSLVHERQVSEVLGVADHGSELVKQLLVGFECAGDWPEALLHELVRLHGLITDQGAASDRLRDLLLADAGDAGRQLAGSGRSVRAVAELEAGYRVHLVGAQLAGARAIHAEACGDELTRRLMFDATTDSLRRVAAHHDVVGVIVAKPETVLPWKRSYGRALTSLPDDYAPAIDRLTGSGTLLLARPDSPSEILELPAGVMGELGPGGHGSRISAESRTAASAGD